MTLKLTPEQLLEIEKRRKKIAELQKQALEESNKELLPHLYGFKWYQWAYDFFMSRNKMNFLCAGNQLSKSSTQIRKAIHWATATELWAELWPHKTPRVFWYLYPTGKQADHEWEKKWKPEFMPQGAMIEDPIYGWKLEKRNKEPYAIHFNSGISIYFKTYKQDAQSLQTGTVDAIFLDEELPFDLFDELINRINASDGYFHMVFTATIGQDEWRRTIEPGPHEEEMFPDAFKKQVSAYDCQFYMDGSPSFWTDSRIKQSINRCGTRAEVEKRIMGKFVLTSGRKYESFDAKRHMVSGHKLPKHWLTYVGIDPGSGGKKSHPSAICFVGVDPTFRQGRVYLGWRGDGQETTAGDTLQKLQSIKRENSIRPVTQKYDWAAKDFSVLASRAGEAVTPAEKSHEIGEQIVNTLFKNDMLKIYVDSETQKLGAELASIRIETPKNKARDDFADALRYAVTAIPWDWSIIGDKLPTEIEYELPETPEERQLRERRYGYENKEETEWAEDLDEEFAGWSELLGN